MCAYLSKTEDECSHAMNQAVKEAWGKKSNNYDQMKLIAQMYASKRECNVQEAMYHIIPELWLRKVFPAVLFANKNLTENRYKVCVSEKEIKQTPESSRDIFKTNMLDWYKDRPSSKFGAGQYSVVNEMCFAEFLRFYYLKRDLVSNDNLPVELTGTDIENKHFPSSTNYPKLIPLTSTKDKMQCHKVPFVLRYDVPNKEKYPEKYYYHLVQLFYPFRDETELKGNHLGT